MAGWHVIEAFINLAGKHSTWAGKFYNTFFDCFRLLFLVSIVDNTFGGKTEGDLECDTQVVGCEKMCQNAFLPVDVITFWAVQMFAVCLPTVIFMTYMVHKLKAVEDARAIKEKKEIKMKNKKRMELTAEEEWLRGAKEELDDDGIQREQIQEIENELDALRNEREEIEEMEQVEKKLNADGIKATSALEQADLTPPKLMLGYFLMVFCRTGIEIGFLYLYFQVYIFNLIMPKEYICGSSPCLSLTTCFIARSTEKTWVLHIMFILALFTLSCSIIELFRLGLEKPYKAWKNRHRDISKNPEYAPANTQTHIPTFAA